MKYIKVILVTAIFTTLSSCVTGDDYNSPDLTGECVTMTDDIAIEDITTTANSNPQLWNSTNGSILEAFVTSSDEGGNFYKSISMVAYDDNQNEFGFSIPVDQYNLFNEFEPGRKIYIKMDNLYYEIYNGLVVGSSYNGSVGRIAIEEYNKVLLHGCEKINEENLVHHISITDALNDSYLNKLIEFENVQFANSAVGKTYYDSNNTAGTGTNHNIIDADGNSIIVRTSEYANFAGEKVPEGNGKIRGVLTKFGSTYQFLIRTLYDVKLNNPRADYTFLNSVNEPFESYGNNASSFTKYFNLATAGTYLWQVKTFSNNKYIQMSAYNSGGSNRALFIVPVNFDNISNLSFKTKDGYNNGSALKVYYSLNFDPQNPSNGTLTDITSNFSIATGSTSGYAANFTNSGTYNFTGTSGYGYVIFEYVGSATGVTTTMQIDDIVLN
ncbi:hypothetical protein FIA58_007385 [Flavobacterium jejuense]|uniref:DUF5689 domain-containing protein n=1 Tax=Flavobacterium jejuense TaxID=1544455 RepID=A0ABX0ITS4_9FLAO|nr:DUF5689 domain-containing protein [Flavobacterium jejuense]NHN25496.1 hypothetical protein [Flavobacterium jejuense]